MRAVMVMFDSLNRRFLPPYGCDWVQAPNFQRLAEKTVTFDRSFVGSMPCIPARRELHTGRYGFLHRSWGPIEPYDFSVPEFLNNNGIHTHLITDHYHYWEDGGATFITRFGSNELVRGQEGDYYRVFLEEPEIPEMLGQERIDKNPNLKRMIRQHWYNLKDNPETPIKETFERGLRFLNENHHADNWYLQLELFDPHEPFAAPQRYRDLYEDDYDGPYGDWPQYGKADMYSAKELHHIRNEYAAMISMCDDYLGKVIDKMDELDMWDDTMLIVCTDHGFMLGEHNWVGKGKMLYYNELANTPFFVWDPRCGKRNERRNAIVQSIDIAPTLMDYFGFEPQEQMEGKVLKDTIASDANGHDSIIFGMHGAHVCCYDGRYTYFRGWQNSDNKPLYNYTLMPTHMKRFFTRDELRNTEYGEAFDFTDGIRLLKTPVMFFSNSFPEDGGSYLFDTLNDPQQLNPIHDPDTEERMKTLMIELMEKNDAPEEQYERLGLIHKEEER